MYRAITAADEWFFDTHKMWQFEIFDEETLGEKILDADGHVVSYENIESGTAQMKDMSGQSLAFQVRKQAKSSTAVISKSSDGSPVEIEVVGVFNANRDLNTQRVEVRIRDKDTYDPAASPPVNVAPGAYAYALKQVTEGDERILLYGPAQLIQAAAWE